MAPKAILPAALSLVLLGMYLSQGSDEQAEPTPPARRTAKSATMEERLALDADRRAEYQESHRPGFSDVGAERKEKELDQMMRRYGNSPLENVDGDSRNPGIVITDPAFDLRSFIASGGSYSGPVPDDVAAELYGGDR